jgi:putative tricarboxylic transport membrane protein
MLGRDGIAGLICLGLSIALLVMTRGLPQSALVPIGPDFYPRIVLGIMAALSVMLIAADVLSRWRSRGAVTAPAAAAEERNYRLVTVTFAVFAVYVLLLPFLGFRVATFLFVVALQAVLEKPQGRRRWTVVITTALATVIVTYLAFEVYLSVLLPRGRWTGF